MSKSTGTDLANKIRSALVRSGRWKGHVNRTGNFWRPYTEIPVVCGLGTGGPDLVGVIRGGRAVCFESKDGTHAARKSQRLWHAQARKWGIFVAVVRSVEEALEALWRAEQGGCE